MFRRFVVLFAGLLPTLAPALTVRPPSFNELVSSADAIVIGIVTRVEYALRPVKDRAVPFTLVTVQIEKTLKGPTSPSVVLQCLGGTVGTESLQVVGAPEFVTGDRGFFFVQSNGTQFFPLVAVTHGIYWTIRDERSGTERVLRASGEPLVSTSRVSASMETTQPRPRPSAGAASEAMTAEEFSKLISAEVTREAR